MQTVRDIKKLEGVPVLVRAALNAEVTSGTVTNDFRLRAALPTIKYLAGRHAKVILIGHVSGSGTESLRPMYEAMRAWIPGIAFCDVATGTRPRDAVRAMVPGEVLMLENLRRDKREERNDGEFARELAALADVFVQDAFDVCHRRHASVVGIPEYLPSYAGLLVEREVAELEKALRPRKPSLAIVGGAKFATKRAVLAMLLKKYDRVFVGGALANDFLKAAGYRVGRSLVSDVKPEELAPLLRNGRLLLPVDAVVARQGGTRAEGRASSLADVRDDDAILDVGPETVRMLMTYANRATSVLWNGPLGNYEAGFHDATRATAIAVARADAYAVIGGGDTVAAIETLGLDDDIGFVSTGGGAMLDFLAQGTLPGIEALG